MPLDCEDQIEHANPLDLVTGRGTEPRSRFNKRPLTRLNEEIAED
jgi:hypothetical protein